MNFIKNIMGFFSQSQGASGPEEGGEAVLLTAADAYEFNERSRMPEELRNARLAASEHVFHRPGPRPFAAEVDQAFLTDDRRILLVETKSRVHVRTRDVVQLSAQRIAVNAQDNQVGEVPMYAYVRLQPPGRLPYYQRVDLLTERQVDALWDRLMLVRARKVSLNLRGSFEECSSCSAKFKCRARVL